ncbi:MAG: hypothetical protein HQL30_03520 [Candidatus Omnitrophica bacterium]|nr:hypothetical protein [Candidatus Omnitrophota bacterium]
MLRPKTLFDNQLLSVCLVSLLAFFLAAGVSGVIGKPVPRIHDEYSYLLAADTFSHGRLTNPTHPMWRHFETFHLTQKPTYMSKYPPGQGLVLALGKVLAGDAAAGIWIGLTLMAGSITWMLWGFVRPPWAIIGGMMAITHLYLGVGGYRSQTYFGGAVAAFGGALLIGSLPRFLGDKKMKNILPLALGLAVLANTRPWEGLILGALSILALVLFMKKEGCTPANILRKLFLPLVVLLVPIVLWMGYYNYRLTGDALEMPYKAYEEQYCPTPVFVWQGVKPAPVYNNIEMKIFYEDKTSPEFYKPGNIITRYGERINELWNFWGGKLLYGIYFGILLIYPALSFRRDKWAVFAYVILIAYFIVIGLSVHFYSHYAAPFTGLVFLLSVKALGEISGVNTGGKKIGRFLLGGYILLAVLLFIGGVVNLRKDRNSEIYLHGKERAKIERYLEKTGKKHLVVVKYLSGHTVHEEWVYNNADIDASSVVWARDMADNSDLFEYYKDRKKWLLEVGEQRQPVKIQPYP